MKKLLSAILLSSAIIGIYAFYKTEPLFGAPLSNIYRSVIPETTAKYYIGTSSPSTIEWNGIYVKDIVISVTCTGCSGAGATFPFTPTSWGNSTTSVIGFTQGIISNASTTFSQLTSGLVGNNNGLLYSFASSSIFGFLPLSAYDAWTHPITTQSATTSVLITSGGLVVNASSTFSTLGSGFIGLNNGLTYGVASSSIFGFTPLSSYDAFTHASATDSATTSVMTLTGGLVSNASSTFATLGTGTVNTNNGRLYGGATTTFSTGLTYATGAVTCDTASGSVFGCLSAANWTAFNAKQATIAVTYPIQLSGATISTAFGTTTANVFNALNTFTNSSSTQFTALTRLYIPSAADPTVAFAGDTALNSTLASTSLRIHDGTAERALYVEKDTSGIFASSTLSYLTSFGSSGTTTLTFRNPNRPTTMTRFFCKTTAGTANMEFGNGSATTTMAVCNTTGVEVSLSSNNTWTRRQNMLISIGTGSATFDRVTPTITLREDAD